MTRLKICYIRLCDERLDDARLIIVINNMSRACERLAMSEANSKRRIYDDNVATQKRRSGWFIFFFKNLSIFKTFSFTKPGFYCKIQNAQIVYELDKN